MAGQKPFTSDKAWFDETYVVGLKVPGYVVVVDSWLMTRSAMSSAFPQHLLPCEGSSGATTNPTCAAYPEPSSLPSSIKAFFYLPQPPRGPSFLPLFALPQRVPKTNRSLHSPHSWRYAQTRSTVPKPGILFHRGGCARKAPTAISVLQLFGSPRICLGRYRHGIHVAIPDTHSVPPQSGVGLCRNVTIRISAWTSRNIVCFPLVGIILSLDA